MYTVFIKYREELPFHVAKRRLNEWFRKAYFETAKWWFDNLLPLHFTKQAASRYGHKPRSAKYLKAKRKAAARGKVKYGGLIDNVYTGAMEDMLRSVAEIKAYPTRATLTMTGPRYMTMRAFDYAKHGNAEFSYGKGRLKKTTGVSGQQPDKVAEITRVTAEEEQVLANIFAASMARQINEFKAPQTTVIKAA